MKIFIPSGIAQFNDITVEMLDTIIYISQGRNEIVLESAQEMDVLNAINLLMDSRGE